MNKEDRASPFDELARGLDQGTISRGRALRLAGGALLAAMVPTLFPREAEAISRAKRRCRRKEGIYLSRGECRCAWTSNAGEGATGFACNGNSDCFCTESAEGRGFCTLGGAVTAMGCSTSAECPTGNTCTVLRYYGGGSCTISADCPATDEGCIRGTCWLTYCRLP